MNHIITVEISIEELRKIITEGVRAELEKIAPKENHEPRYLTRFETANILKVSLVTLNSWAKNGRIKSHRIGSRVYYKMDNIDGALKERKYKP